MKISILVKQLQQAKRKYGDIDVKYAHNDNAEYEASGEVCSILFFDKEDFREDIPDTDEDESMFSTMPDACMILRG